MVIPTLFIRIGRVDLKIIDFIIRMASKDTFLRINNAKTRAQRLSLIILVRTKIKSQTHQTFLVNTGILRLLGTWSYRVTVIQVAKKPGVMQLCLNPHHQPGQRLPCHHMNRPVLKKLHPLEHRTALLNLQSRKLL